MSTPLLVALGFVAGLLLMVAAAVVLRRVWTRESRLRTVTLTATVLGLKLWFALLVAELLLWAFFVRSYQSGYVLANQRWHERYWTPRNQEGLRDRDRADADFAGKRICVVAGDSFAAGFGIADWRQRFSCLLEDKLGPGWVVVTIADNGWDTAEELARVRAFPRRPDVIVLSYYINDIDVTAYKHGIRFWQPRIDNGLVRTLVDRSHVLNLAYWTLYNLTRTDMSQRYWLYVRDCYENDGIWREHAADLRAFAALARERHARLVSVVFPELANLEASRPFTQRVVDLLRDEGATVIDLADRLRGRPTAELIVHPGDRHASAALHREVAAWLYEVVK